MAGGGRSLTEREGAFPAMSDRGPGHPQAPGSLTCHTSPPMSHPGCQNWQSVRTLQKHSLDIGCARCYPFSHYPLPLALDNTGGLSPKLCRRGNGCSRGSHNFPRSQKLASSRSPAAPTLRTLGGGIFPFCHSCLKQTRSRTSLRTQEDQAKSSLGRGERALPREKKWPKYPHP